MPKTLHEKVREFQKLAEVPLPEKPSKPSKKLQQLGLALIKEEWDELWSAILSADQNPVPEIDTLTEVADALADLLYVVAWNGNIWGLPMVEIFEEVHKSNLCKFGQNAKKDPNTGKVLKPEGWEPPKIQTIIENKLGA